MAARAGGLLSRAARALEKALLKRERVGTDPQGNVYFRGPRLNPTTRAEVEARWVSLSGGRGPSDYTPDMVPPEWSRWLTKGRDEPPTPEELAKYEAERGALAQRVRALEDEEAKRRLRMETAGVEQQAAAAQPSMGRFLEQLGGQGYGQTGGGSPGGKKKPGGSSEPSGDGDAYKPGAWVPGQQ